MTHFASVSTIRIDLHVGVIQQSGKTATAGKNLLHRLAQRARRSAYPAWLRRDLRSGPGCDLRRRLRRRFRRWVWRWLRLCGGGNLSGRGPDADVLVDRLAQGPAD